MAEATALYRFLPMAERLLTQERVLSQDLLQVLTATSSATLTDVPPLPQLLFPSQRPCRLPSARMLLSSVMADLQRLPFRLPAELLLTAEQEHSRSLQVLILTQ